MKELFLGFSCVCLLASAATARQPAAAGRFYPADPKELAALADEYLTVPAGEKPVPGAVAVLAPHAGYQFSGRLAAMAYRAAGEKYDTVVILATGHTEGVKGAALLAGEAYETPLGKVQPDRDLAAALLKASPLFEDRPSAHVREHAVEVQLPFLQRKLKKPFKLLAATLNTGELSDLKKIGAALAAALRGKNALLVISADFSHYPAKADAAASDGALALAISSMDPALVHAAAGLIMAKKIPGLETCACGLAALEAGMEAARLLGAKSFLPLKISDSNEENPGAAGPERVVGYISGVFSRTGAPAELALSKPQKEALLKEARQTLVNAFDGVRAPAALAADPRLNLPGAAFVTLTRAGRLRGCVGTVKPALTLLDAVRHGAAGAAFNDGRFAPLEREELEQVKIEVSVLSPMRPAKAAEIKPWKHGVLAAAGGRSGLFLPQVWEQIPAKEDFLGELCSQKAGLPRDCWKDPATELSIFTVDAFAE
ncbi:MAG: AmmeMemoRadiSam system protein B [Elusimicrobiales bacterium]|nr:AmmeMemoRadiSam system protein B [Elusimicrobiales bacterium]